MLRRTVVRAIAAVVVVIVVVVGSVASIVVVVVWSKERTHILSCQQSDLRLCSADPNGCLKRTQCSNQNVVNRSCHACDIQRAGACKQGPQKTLSAARHKNLKGSGKRTVVVVGAIAAIVVVVVVWK